jgi:hypothetical protein
MVLGLGVPARADAMPDFFSWQPGTGGAIANEGFTGSTQTGYSTNTQIGFGSNQNGALCGNNGPPNYAGQYVAHA